ncbi:hypothetical protein WHT83_10215 [Aminobacter sp. P9b]|uniref:hypothetical protein n=1 Tax=Aminobacter sp. P9b TaxID=3133697 RepID=UPI00324A3F81
MLAANTLDGQQRLMLLLQFPSLDQHARSPVRWHFTIHANDVLGRIDGTELTPPNPKVRAHPFVISR